MAAVSLPLSEIFHPLEVYMLAVISQGFVTAFL